MIIDQIYDAATNEEAFEALPARLAEAMGARSTNLLTLSPNWEPQALNFSYFTAEMNDYFFKNALWEHDLWMGVAMRHAKGGIVASCDDFLTPEMFKSGVFYNEFIRHFGDDSIHCFGTSFDAGGKKFTLGIQRGEGSGAFGAEQVAALQALVPHLQRSMLIRERLEQADIEKQAATQTLNRLSLAILRVDRSRRVLFANQHAERIIRADDGIRVRNGCLRLADPTGHDRFDRAVVGAADRSGKRGDAMTARRPSARASYRITISPAGMEPDGQALILIDDPATARRDLADVFRAMFGLTRQEAMLAVRLSEGFTPEEVSNERMVALTTVRTQVRSLLAKMERRRLTEATIDFVRVAALSLAGSEGD